MNKNGKQPSVFSVTAFLRCLLYAGRGISTAVKTQQNAKLHLIAAFIVTIAGFYFKITAHDWLWIVMAITLVWTTELFNSAIEYLCDLIHPDFHEAVKHAKDIAAGAVLVTVIASIIIGLVIFVPYLKAAFIQA